MTEDGHHHGVRLTVAYDGTDFCGFQWQRGQRTVQAELEKAAERITRHPVKVRGAGRTDAGVHAEGQVIAFATSRQMDARRWTLSLNRYLPPDISVSQMTPCAADYDPRFDAKDKTYRYLFHLAPLRDALLANRAWHLGRHVRFRFPQTDCMDGGQHLLDLEAMERACQVLQGTHDFRAFRAAADTRETTERTLSRVALLPQYAGNARLLALEVTGTAFMKNMVRILAGTLVDIGKGQMDLAHLRHLLSPEGDRQQAGMTAPPQGLTLLRVSLGRLREKASR